MFGWIADPPPEVLDWGFRPLVDQRGPVAMRGQCVEADPGRQGELFQLVETLGAGNEHAAAAAVKRQRRPLDARRPPAGTEHAMVGHAL